tara:strand:- start:47 stop:790 length:744 start_codon:yes stop_codon:yes gene_type:complete
MINIDKKYNKNKLSNLLIWGSGSKSKIIINMISNKEVFYKKRNLYNNLKITGIFDPFEKKLNNYKNLKIYNSKKHLLQLIKINEYFTVCIGNEHGYSRNLISEKIEKKGLKPVSIISASSYIDTTSIILKGCLVMPNAMVGPFVKIGQYSILNSSCIIEHEVKIGKGCHIMSGATIGGRARIGNYVSIGMNSTIFPDIKIGEGAFIGAGAVIRNDVNRNQIIIGNPGKVLRVKNKNNKVDILKTNLL